MNGLDSLVLSIISEFGPSITLPRTLSHILILWTHQTPKKIVRDYFGGRQRPPPQKCALHSRKQAPVSMEYYSNRFSTCAERFTCPH